MTDRELGRSTTNTYFLQKMHVTDFEDFHGKRRHDEIECPQAKSKTAHFPTPSHHEPPKNLTQTFSVANKYW